MFRKGLLLLLSILIVGLNILTSFIPVSAISNPSSIAILDKQVFRNVKETGDQLWYCKYNVVYASQPAEDASDTYQFAIYNTTGTTLLYSTDLNYYQINIISIYLTPAQALTWSTAYKVKVMGKPGAFSSIVEGVNMTTSTLDTGADFSEGSTLGDFLLGEAEYLQTAWSITLLSGGKLNATGSTTFTTAIPGLMDVTPEIFCTVVTQPDITYKNWTEAYSSTNSNAGPKLQAALGDIGKTFFGIDAGAAAWMFTGILSVLLGSVVFATTGSSGAALVFMFLALPLSASLGLHQDLFRAMALILTVIAILFGITFILARFV